MRLAAIATSVFVLAACAAPAGRGPGPDAGTTSVDAPRGGQEPAVAPWNVRCEHGFAIDCRKLGRAYLNGAGVPADDRMAAAYLMKGCEIGEPASCSDLAVLTLLGRGVSQDDAAGGALTRRACDAGYALACSNLGTLTIEGVNRLTLRPDEEGKGGKTIVRSFQTACEAGALEGCLNLGTASERGDLVEKDLARAARAFQRACDGGLPIACSRWALLAIQAPDTVPQPDIAALNRRACRAGIAPACMPPGQAPGPVGPQTPSPRLVSERYSYALGIPGAGGFHPVDFTPRPAGQRRGRERLRPLSAGQLASVPEALRQRLALGPPAAVEPEPDEPVELLLRLRRAQLAVCLERERSNPDAARMAASFLVESNGRPGELRAATEPADAGLEDCAMDLIQAWSFPVPDGGLSGPYLVRFDFEAAPPGLAPAYASRGVLRAALKEPGCVERHLRVPPPYRGAENAVIVKLAVDTAGRPLLFHALTPAPEPLVAAIGEAVRACAFTPGIGDDGRPVALWLTLAVKLDGH